ncbi:unnamed protein product [Cylicocyclus nassatus]|uniref:Uncharacterized protein n=1 Tax=Cylicocyclus nassatus TaxID=53992 RepID=A0AA36MIA7_CYLNA|nr:unnamed protein product [Cylicocyclus nassatus]
MFLIAKIVRGRRLLHELEQQEKDQAVLDAAQAAAASSSGQQQSRHRASRDGKEKDERDEEGQKRRSSRKSVRRKTNACGSIDLTLAVNDRMAMRRTSSMPSICETLEVPKRTPTSLKHYDYESKLNKMQRRSLRFTWHRLHTRNGGKRVENVFEEVFDRLVRALPCVRDMFATRMFLSAMSRNETASLRDHAKVTVKMFDLIIKNMDAEPHKRTDTGFPLDPKIIGRAHGPLRPYGLTGQFWEKLGEVIIDVVLGQEAVRDLPGAGQAWVIFTACLIDQMRAGFDENKEAFPIFPKRETVLLAATKHLHDTEDSEEQDDKEQNTSTSTAVQQQSTSVSAAQAAIQRRKSEADGLLAKNKQ